MARVHLIRDHPPVLGIVNQALQDPVVGSCVAADPEGQERSSRAEHPPGLSQRALALLADNEVIEGAVHHHGIAGPVGQRQRAGVADGHAGKSGRARGS